MLKINICKYKLRKIKFIFNNYINTTLSCLKMEQNCSLKIPKRYVTLCFYAVIYFTCYKENI